MTIEATLLSIDSGIKALLVHLQTNSIAQDESGVAGALADPVVAQQVGAAIAAAAPAAKPARGRGRPRTEPETVVPPAAEPDPFAIVEAAAVAEKPRTMEEVRAALIVYQSRNSQPAALKLIADTTGKETLAKLDVSDLPKLFKAALAGDAFTVDDVKIVLVKAEERRTGGGAEVLQKYEAVIVAPDGTKKITINALKPEHFIAAINMAHGVK